MELPHSRGTPQHSISSPSDPARSAISATSTSPRGPNSVEPTTTRTEDQVYREEEVAMRSKAFILIFAALVLTAFLLTTVSQLLPTRATSETGPPLGRTIREFASAHPKASHRASKPRMVEDYGK